MSDPLQNVDSQGFRTLLEHTQAPDTEKLKQVTAELQKNWYPRPEALLLLIENVCLHPDDGVRQFAAVQATRLVSKHWPKVPATHKPTVRNHLLNNLQSDPNRRCRHLRMRLISEIASLDLAKGEWKDLFQTMFGMVAEDQPVEQRELGSYLIYCCVEADPRHFNEVLGPLFGILRRGIQDQQSLDVRVNSTMAIGSALLLVDTDDPEDQEKVELVQSLIPSMADVLRSAVAAGDDEKAKNTFETLQQFLAYDSALLGKYLKDLMQFMVEIASNTEADEDSRSQALAFLTQAVRYRRMKLMGMSDLIKLLVEKSLQILTELDDDEDDDETTPARASLSLLAQLATDLPPRHVIVPLLDQFALFSASSEVSHRKAGIIALGICAEGAPDFVMTQMKTILPVVIRLLNDSEIEVRHAALVGLTRLAEEMSEDVATEHEALITALLKNLQAAETEGGADEKARKKNNAIIRSVCAAFDAMCDGVKAEVMQKYAPQLLDPIGRLLSHDDARVKISAAGAIGALATSMDDEFKPYFERTMAALGPYMSVKETEEDLTLRSGISDALGRIAIAVGPETFKPYVPELMRASEESLHLDNPELRESSFILWSSLAKVYEKDFGPFIEGAFTALFNALELEEEEVVLNLTEEEEAIVGDARELITAGKRVKIRTAADDDDAEGGDGMGDEDDDEDAFEDFVESAEAMEKEVAIEVLGDIISHSCGLEEIRKYLEKAVEIIAPLVSHSYEGCRKSSVSTLWRAYARVWQLTEEATGGKWEPGFPVKQPPSEDLQKLGEIVAKSTLSLWVEESDRDVVTEINRMVANTLKSCGPAILSHEDTLTQVISALTTIITRSHPCQQDLGDEEEEHDVQESSEYDWLVIDTALDVIIGLATAFGPAFQELWKIFNKPVIKFASSSDALERSTAVGVIAECINHMGADVTPHTATLLPLLIKRLSDEDPETRSNAAYGIGLLIFHSTAVAKYQQSFEPVLSKLEAMLRLDAPTSRLVDNAAGCLCRMIMVHADRVPLAEFLPLLVAKLPLTDDFEENSPIYQCIYKLYEQNDPIIMALTPNLIPIFEAVLSPPKEQLTPETRRLVQEVVQILHVHHPEVFRNNPGLIALIP